MPAYTHTGHWSETFWFPAYRTRLKYIKTGKVKWSLINQSISNFYIGPRIAAAISRDIKGVTVLQLSNRYIQNNIGEKVKVKVNVDLYSALS